MTHDILVSFSFLLSDTDNDEIEIVNQNDYEIFLAKCEHNMHVQIAPLAPVQEEVQAKASKQENAAPSADDPSNFIIHDNVECDGCGVGPIVGFRYKCVQCSNFDLCQRCEAAHKHPEHLMVRMPTNDGPNVVEAWLTGPTPWGGRRCGRRSRGHCPFDPTQAAGGAAPAGDSARESRRERRHARRHGGVLSQFVEMMTNLPLNEPTATGSAEPQQQAKAAEPTVTAQKAAETEAPTAHKKTNAAPTVPPTEEPPTAPRSGEQTQGSAPTTPVINLENLTQMVPPEYMRAGIEILNNFSEMFAKMIDPTESPAPSMASSAEAAKPTEKTQSGGQSMASSANQSGGSSTAPSANQSGAPSANQSGAPSTVPSANPSGAPSVAESLSEAASLETEPLLPKTTEATAVASESEPLSRRSDSLDQDWQVIDNAYSANNTSSANTDALINLDQSINPPTAAPQQPVRDFGQLGELLRQHMSEEARIEQTTANTQTPQVDTVSTSTSTTSVSTNSVGTSPSAPEEKRSVPIFHTGKSP